MTRKQRTKANERYRQQWEDAFVQPIQKALKSQISSFTNDVSLHGLAIAQSRLSNQVLNEKIGMVIQKLYTVAGVDKANKVLRQLKQEPKVVKKASFGFNEEWTNQIKDYFSLHLFNKVVIPITETTKEQIRQKIQQMTEDGESIEWLVQQLESSDITAWRARMIARTESNRAINHGAQMGAEKSKFMATKEWVAVHDERTRHSHALLDGKVMMEKEDFKPGLAFPGDPNAPAGETINCRCHLEYKLLRNKDGRLIPKEGPRVRVNNRLAREFDAIIAALN